MKKAALVVVALLGLLTAKGVDALGTQPTVGTQTFTNVVTYTVPTVTEVTTQVVTETVTAPTTTTAPPPPQLAADKLVGLSVHLADDPAVVDAQVARYKDAGAQVLRDDFAWAWSEPTRGAFNFRRIEAICDAAAKYDVKLLPQIGFAPRWANGGRQDKVGPYNVDDFGRWAGTLSRWLVDHGCADRVVGIEPWNEPNWTFLIHPHTGAVGDPVYYAALNNAAYAAIHANSDIPVIAGATAGVGVVGDWQAPTAAWVERTLDAGTKFDAWSLHPYEFGDNMTAERMLTLSMPTAWARALWGSKNTNTGAPVESIPQLLYRRRGYTGPIHATEWGAPTDRPDGSAAHRGTSEANQAELIRLGVPMWRAHPQGGHLLVYTADDYDSWDTADMEKHFGLWRSDKSAKPALARFRDAAAR